MTQCVNYVARWANYSLLISKVFIVKKVKVAHSCPTLCNPLNCSPRSSSLHGILQARLLEPFPSPGDLPDPGIKLRSPTLQAAFINSINNYGCENWTIKKAECQRIDALELWCWRRHLRVPWTARRSNQSILKEINSEYSLDGLMLKLQFFGHLMRRADWKRLWD